MSTFDQKNQQVGTQYNVAGNQLIQGNIAYRNEFMDEWRRIKCALRDGETSALGADAAAAVDKAISKIDSELVEERPKKSVILESLERLEEVLKVGSRFSALLVQLKKFVDFAREFS